LFINLTGKKEIIFYRRKDSLSFMSNAKILVGTPIFEFHDYCFEEYSQRLKDLTYPNKDLLLVDNTKGDTFYKKILSKGIPAIHMDWLEKSRDRVTKGHNIMREKMLKEGYEYLFLLDADVIPPKDIIERFLAHGKKIVSGVYYNPMTCPDKIVRSLPVIRVPFPGDKTKWSIPLKCPENLFPIAGAGTGCLLIHRSILEKYKFWHDSNAKGCDDTFFFKTLYEDDVPMFADGSFICEHRVEEKPYSWEKKDFKEGTY
jgi:hypothetical protein